MVSEMGHRWGRMSIFRMYCLPATHPSRTLTKWMKRSSVQGDPAKGGFGSIMQYQDNERHIEIVFMSNVLRWHHLISGPCQKRAYISNEESLTSIQEDKHNSQFRGPNPSSLRRVVKMKRDENYAGVPTFSLPSSHARFSTWVEGIVSFPSFTAFLGSEPRLYNRCLYTPRLRRMRSSSSVSESCST